jgi:hypothetical protein
LGTSIPDARKLGGLAPWKSTYNEDMGSRDVRPVNRKVGDLRVGAAVTTQRRREGEEKKREEKRAPPMPSRRCILTTRRRRPQRAPSPALAFSLRAERKRTSPTGDRSHGSRHPSCCAHHSFKSTEYPSSVPVRVPSLPPPRISFQNLIPSRKLSRKAPEGAFRGSAFALLSRFFRFRAQIFRCDESRGYCEAESESE